MTEQQKKHHFSKPNFLHIQNTYIICNKIIEPKMLQRPKFVFEQQEEASQEIANKTKKVQRYVTEVGAEKAFEADRQKNLEMLQEESDIVQDNHNMSTIVSNNPEMRNTPFRSPTQYINTSSKLKEKEGLRYKKPQTHMNVLVTSAAAKPTENAGINKSLHQYQDRIHLQEAKEMKPNHFFREDNRSPKPQTDQKFTLAPQPEYAPTTFDPYKYVGLNKRRSNNKSYQIMLDSDLKKNKKPMRKQTVQTSNESSFNNSSHIELNPDEKKQKVIKQSEADVIIEEKEDAALQYPQQGTIVSYDFVIQKIFGTNYLNPDFKISSPDGEVLVSAKKESFHFNSHFNIYGGDIKNQKRIGILRGNFGGSEFNVYHLHDNIEQIVATICYKVEISCRFAYRKVELYVKNPESNRCLTEEQTNGKNLKEEFESGNNIDIIKIITKQPTWREDLQCYVMNFKGKSRMSSRKNAILIKQNSKENMLMFCKQGYNKFYLQISYPLNLLISMGFLLTSFDFKLLCQ